VNVLLRHPLKTGDHEFDSQPQDLVIVLSFYLLQEVGKEEVLADGLADRL
jgi:hypothetical protein